MVEYLVKNKRYISLFLLIYSVVNSYIVNKTLKCTGAQPPEIEQHKMETEGLRKKRLGVSITDIHQKSLHQESLQVLVSKRWEWELCYFFLALCQEPSGLSIRQGGQLFICWERCCGTLYSLV